jgi:tetratricopeptide (TPR) repeat protein
LISAQTGLVADRYYYLWFASLGVAAALLFDRLPRVARSPLWVALPALAYATWVRGFDWKDDFTLFGASLDQGRHERSAFFLAFYYQDKGDCLSAIPLYERALHLDMRAGPNLQACLVELGRNEEAAALGAEIVKGAVVSVSAYNNTARALVALGRLEEAQSWALRGSELSPPGDARSLVLLGNIRGLRGDLEGAARAFETASRIAPTDPEVQAGLRAVAHATAVPE